MMQDIIDKLILDFQNTGILEALAVITGVMSVWYSKKENILVFPTGIISVLLYVYICYFGKLYADMFVNIVYFIMSVYGWYNWTHQNGEVKEKPIGKLKTQHIILYIGITIALFFFIRFILNNTDSNVPNLDSLTTAIFLVSMWLMALKKVEHWLGWILGNMISVPLYAYKGLVLTSLQFTLFLIIAVAGYIAWTKKLKQYE